MPLLGAPATIEGVNLPLTSKVQAACHALRPRRLMLAIPTLGLAALGLVLGLGGFRTAPAAGQGRVAEATPVTVTAGKPSEFSFKLSRSSALPWQGNGRSSSVTFKVTNRGELSHRFKICSAPVAEAALVSCNGSSTKLLEPGQSSTLTVVFGRRGSYEYLSSVPGQAAKGMKGLLGIGVNLPAKATAAAPTTTTPSSTAPSSTGPATTGSATTGPAATTTSPATTAAAALGAALWQNDGCSDCHTVAEAAAAAGGNIDPSLNSTHPGGPFPDGPLSATQISELAAYISGR